MDVKLEDLKKRLEASDENIEIATGNIHIDSIDADPICKITEMANGNPGVVEVLAKIATIDVNFLNPLKIMMDLTDSNHTLLWIVYKDICEFDIDKTMDYLKTWFSNHHVNLNDYIKITHPDGRHF